MQSELRMKNHLAALLLLAFFIGGYFAQNTFAKGEVFAYFTDFASTDSEGGFLTIYFIKFPLSLIRNITRSRRLKDSTMLYINSRESGNILNVIKDIWHNMPFRYLQQTMILAFLISGLTCLILLNNLRRNVPCKRYFRISKSFSPFDVIL